MMECMVHKCQNRSNDESGHGVVLLAPKRGLASPTFQWMCYSCWEFMVDGNVHADSQLKRNSIEAAKKELAQVLLDQVQSKE